MKASVLSLVFAAFALTGCEHLAYYMDHAKGLISKSQCDQGIAKSKWENGQ